MKNTIKRTILLLMTVCAASLFLSCKNSSTAVDHKVSWKDYSEGLKTAASRNKPVVMFFYADWCRYCKLMDATTFSDDNVVKKLQSSFISVRIDTTSGNGTIPYQKKEIPVSRFLMSFGVSGMPTTLFLNSSGKVITKIPGFIEKDVFLSFLNYIDEECYKKQVSFEDYQNGKVLCDKRKQ